MIRAQIQKDLKNALGGLGFSGGEVVVCRMGDARFGDYSTNVALKIGSSPGRGSPRATNKTKVEPHFAPHSGASRGKQSAMEIAKKIADSMQGLPYIEKLEVKEPGFINFFVKDEIWQKEVENVLKLGAKYGSNDSGSGKKARVEFVSANPTGPLHFGNARGGPIGDAIAQVLAASGYEVLREYIDNNRGNQVRELGKTLAAVAGFIKVKDEEMTYKGEYTKELAKKVKLELSDLSGKNDDEIVRAFGEAGVNAQFKEIIADCRLMGIKFDLVVHESDLQTKAKAEIAKLEKKGLIKKKDGALWFSPHNEFLEDRDAVVVKSDGNYTYFTADVVYHSEKFESGYDLVIDVFGSNTFGHVPKLKALAAVLNFDLSKFIVILYQFVRIKRGNDIVSMSKRAGHFVTAREVIDDIGRDAVRFFILMHDANSPIDFDLELAKEKSSKNPVYYVQYAGARIVSILEKLKVKSEKLKVGRANLHLLSSDYELALIKQITRLPELVEDISKSFAVHQLTTYAKDLADAFHKFYENCRVVGEEKELEEARVALLLATRTALKNTLALLGISAPEKM